MDSQDYIEVSFPLADEQAGDIVVAIVSELGFDSFVYEEGVQKCYIQRSLFDEDALRSVVDSFNEFAESPLEWTAVQMPGADWNQEWEKSGFTPIECGDFIVVPYDGSKYEGQLAPLYLQPKMAFGTGHHNTTFMMMQAMQDYKDRIHGASVMDLGCGTAVLAILAAKLGAGEVAGIDIDAVAVRSALENIRINSLDFPVLCGDASSMPGHSYDILLANIHRNIIIDGLPIYSKVVREGGLLFVSGFYLSDVDAILEAASANGFFLFGPKEKSIRSNDEWTCMILVKGPNQKL